MTKHFRLHALIVLTPLVGAGIVRAEPPVDEKARAEAFQAFAKQEAAAYTLRLEGSDRQLKLQPEPVLKWSNPVIGTIYGDVFIWTDQGRPEAVASIYKFYSAQAHRANEFHSLSLGTLVATRNGLPVWTPARPGLAFKPIAGAPPPAQSAAARLRQMRGLAQQFTGRQTNREGVDRDMRLLTNPIYRYEKTQGDLIDGGLFVFVLGTDPEAFLLIEARRLPSGAADWRFGATRMNSIELRINQHEREVWRAPVIPWSQVWDSGEPYTIFRYELAPENTRQ